MEAKEHLLLVVCFAVLLVAFRLYSPTQDPRAAIFEKEVSPLLQEHSQTWNGRQVLKVTEGIHSAVNYALANSILVEGPKGNIVIDTTESEAAAAEIKQEFDKISNKTLKAIIYTHFHTDHIQGATSFIGELKPEVWAHHTLPASESQFTRIGAINMIRGRRQFGFFLEDEERNHAGIGVGLREDTMVSRFVRPTHFLREKSETINIAGLEIKLLHLPGETSDQIGVWIPSRRTLMCADDVYRTFPNLYAIRGTPARNVLDWVSSLDMMLELRPAFLVPSHGYPVKGEEKIRDILTLYRDAIQFVHDQTVRYINQGLLPDEIVELVTLPKAIKGNPYLREHYGTVRWSVRAIFDFYLGWFSGDPVDLNPLSAKERSQRMLDMVGGVKAMLKQASSAVDSEDWQWGLELASHVYRLDKSNVEALNLRTKCIIELGAQQTSPNGRNYYLTSVLEDNSLVNNKMEKELAHRRMNGMTMDQILPQFVTRYKAEECGDEKLTLVYHFTDSEKIHSFTMRNGVLIFHKDTVKEHFDVKITTTESVFKELLQQKRSGFMAYLTGSLQVEGGLWTLKTFMSCLEMLQ